MGGGAGRVPPATIISWEGVIGGRGREEGHWAGVGGNIGHALHSSCYYDILGAGMWGLGPTKGQALTP